MAGEMSRKGRMAATQLAMPCRAARTEIPTQLGGQARSAVQALDLDIVDESQ